MPNFYADNDDLRFYLERGIDWAPVVEATEFGSRALDADGSCQRTACACDSIDIVCCRHRWQSTLEAASEFDIRVDADREVRSRVGPHLNPKGRNALGRRHE